MLVVAATTDGETVTTLTAGVGTLVVAATTDAETATSGFGRTAMVIAPHRAFEVSFPKLPGSSEAAFSCRNATAASMAPTTSAVWPPVSLTWLL
jgi:hypothetical protein